MTIYDDLSFAGQTNERSLEYWRYPREDLAHDCVRNAFHFLAAARGEIESAGLVTADNPRRLGAGSRQGHGETCRARELTAARDRQDYGKFRYPVKGLRRHDQHRAAALLLVARSRVETDEPDFAALHARSIARFIMRSIR